MGRAGGAERRGQLALGGVAHGLGGGGDEGEDGPEPGESSTIDVDVNRTSAARRCHDRVMARASAGMTARCAFSAVTM